MSQIRKAHSVEIIDRRLRNCETSTCSDAMELVGICDELSRVERKWLEKQNASNQPKRPRDRPLSDPAQMNARFDRLTRLVDAALRQLPADTAGFELLKRSGDDLHRRRPLSPRPGAKTVEEKGSS